MKPLDGVAPGETVIFLDDGGVLNDNTRRGPEWERLVGEYLAPRLGGTPEAWAEANRVVFDGMWREFEGWLETRRIHGADGYVDYFGEQRDRWLRDMCARVGVGAPAGAACRHLALATEDYVLPRVRSAYPGAAAAVRELRRRGYALHIASGGSQRELEAYVSSVGVRDCFGERLYGTDLVQALKESPVYYQRIFADTGVAPERALVVDDTPRVVRWAAEAGARTVLVSKNPPEETAAVAVAGSLAELVGLLPG